MSPELVAGLGGALLGAFLTGVFGWWLHRIEQTSAQHEELRNIITKLVDLQEEFQTKVMPITDLQMREFAGTLLNTKRTVYLESAQNLVRKIPRTVSSSEYARLAFEFANDSNFTQAEAYYERALQSAQSTLAKVVAARGIAAFYFGQGPQRDFARARQYFEQAIDLLKNPTDAYSLYTLGYTYETWGLVELYNGFIDEGNRKLSFARKYYNDLPNDYRLKHQSLAAIEAKINHVMHAREYLPKTAATGTAPDGGVIPDLFSAGPVQ